MNGNDSTEDEDTNNNTNTHQEELKSRSVSGEYYARGSAEVATESALTLAKVEHVSRIKSAWREIRGRMWGVRICTFYSYSDEDSYNAQKSDP